MQYISMLPLLVLVRVDKIVWTHVSFFIQLKTAGNNVEKGFARCHTNTIPHLFSHEQCLRTLH